MKQQLEKNLGAALARYIGDNGLEPGPLPAIEVEYARDSRHGDFASNAAMALAGPLRKAPRQIAQGLLERMPADPLVEKIEIAGPGFINFHLSPVAWLQVVPAVHAAGERYGHSTHGKGARILVEYVSVNPTGPIHVGHGRHAAYGSTLASLLEAAGYAVTREYYVNDAGRQMDILSLSVWLRYLESAGLDIDFPANAYNGAYVSEIAERLGGELAIPGPDKPALTQILDADLDGDKKLDRLISLAKATLGDSYIRLFDFTLNDILAIIREDLDDFGVSFDNWFSERSLFTDGAVTRAIEALQKRGETYEKDGALWFSSTRFGDEKDRVIVRENGQTTYFASDIAYHVNKLERGFDWIINVWGADHHGYISRVKGALTALEADADKLTVLLVQFATLYKGDQKLQMSTRSGEYVTLKQLRDEVGNDAARFFYVTRKSEQHLDFDLELAKSQSNANPVYYIQYAHARICSVFKQMRERNLEFDLDAALSNLELLREDPERALARTLSRYDEVILTAAKGYDPHLIAYYLRELANDFHAYYNTCQFLIDDAALRQARLGLISATRQVIRNGLGILGVSAPEEM